MPADPDPDAEQAEDTPVEPQNPSDLAWWIKIHTGPNTLPEGLVQPL